MRIIRSEAEATGHGLMPSMNAIGGNPAVLAMTVDRWLCEAPFRTPCLFHPMSEFHSHFNPVNKFANALLSYGFKKASIMLEQNMFNA
jgi:hypothetical protein